MNLLLGLGACSDSDGTTGDRNDAVHADASSDGAAAERSDAGAAKPNGSRRDEASASDAAASDAPKMDASAKKDAPAEPDVAPEKKKKQPERSEPEKKPAEPVDAGHAEAKDSGSDAGPPPPVSEDTFALRVVASGLSAPWEIAAGPDKQLWITERTGRVVRVDPASGSLSVALTLPDVHSSSAQDGLLGMALHPLLSQALSNDFVYLAYTYDADASDKLERRARIVRYSYDPTTQTLGSAQTLIENLPASSDHNAGRLVFGPDNYLYYSVGDQGHNQYEQKCLAIRAQDVPTQADLDAKDWATYQGKILRLGLDGSIPESNPAIAGLRTHIFSYGHRNALGLAFGPDGKLYASEPGPQTDDEINLIAAGRNYGWPNVAGYRDDNAYTYANWSASMPEACDTLNYSDYVLPDSVPKQLESAWDGDYVTPLRTFYTVDNSFSFVNANCAEDPSICWPTVAPSSLDVYVPGESGLQSWGTALLVPSLKNGSVLRVKLSANGELTEGNSTELFKTTNRYRDLAIASNKRTFYVVTDNDGSTSSPSSAPTSELQHRGAVLEFTYTPTP